MRTMLTSLEGVYDPKAPVGVDENEREQQDEAPERAAS
jgi:hypothetical protein